MQAEFKRRKQKVGKKKLAPANVTNTSFKWATLNIARPDIEAEEGRDEAEKRAADFKDLLSTSRHHNVTSRKESIISLRKLVTADTVLLAQNVASVIGAIADRVIDPEAPVRTATQALLRVVISSLPWITIRPFLPLLSAHMSSALSKLQTSVRLDALAFAADLIQVMPQCNAQLLGELGGSVVSALEPQLHSLVSSSVLPCLMPGVYDIGAGAIAAAAAAAAAAASKPGASSGGSSTAGGMAAAAAAAASASAKSGRRKMTSVEARIAVVFVLRRMLLRGREAPSAGDGTDPRAATRLMGEEGDSDDSDSDTDDGDATGARSPAAGGSVLSDVTGLGDSSAHTGGSGLGAGSNVLDIVWNRYASADGGNGVASLQPEWTPEAVSTALTADLSSVDWSAPLGSLRSSSGASPEATTEAAVPAEFPEPLAQEAVLQLLHLWLECSPSEGHAAPASVLFRLSLIAQTLRLLFQASPTLLPSSFAPSDAVACFTPVTVQDGNLLRALRGAMDDKVSAVRAGGAHTVQARVAVTRLLVRAVISHVWLIYPVVPSSLASKAHSPHSAACALLNTRLVELVSVLVPRADALTAARALMAAAAPGGAGDKGSAGAVSAVAGNSGVVANPFALLAPKPRETPEAAIQPAKAAPAPQGPPQKQARGAHGQKRKWNEAPATSPPAAAVPAAPTVHLSQSQQSSLRRGSAEAAKLVTAALGHIAAQLAEALPASGIAAGGSAAAAGPLASQLHASALLPCTLQLLESRLLEHAPPGDVPALLTAVTRVYSSTPPRSPVKSRCLQFMVRLLQRSASSGAPATLVPVETEDAWLRSYPRLLWALGVSDVPASRAILQLLLEQARRAPPMSARSSTLADVARQCAPLLYTTRPAKAPASGAGASGSSSAGAPPEEGVLGPFASYTRDLQSLLLGFLRQAGQDSPALRRGLCVVARVPGTPDDVAHELAHTGCELARGRADADSAVTEDAWATGDASSSARVPRSNAEQLAFLLSLSTGRAITVSALSSGPQLLVGPHRPTDAGVVSATFESVGRHAVKRADGPSEPLEAPVSRWALEGLCDSDDGAYGRTLRVTLASTAGLLPAVCGSPAAASAVSATIWEALSQLHSDEAAQPGSPSHREAALVVTLQLVHHRLCCPPPAPAFRELAARSMARLHAHASAAVAAHTDGGMSVATSGVARRPQGPLVAPSVASLLSPLEPLSLLSDASSAQRAVYTLLLRGDHDGSDALCELLGCLARESSTEDADATCSLVLTLLRSPAFAPAWREAAVQCALRTLVSGNHTTVTSQVREAASALVTA